MLAMESREKLLLELLGRVTGKDAEALENAVFVEPREGHPSRTYPGL